MRQERLTRSPTCLPTHGSAGVTLSEVLARLHLGLWETQGSGDRSPARNTGYQIQPNVPDGQMVQLRPREELIKQLINTDLGRTFISVFCPPQLLLHSNMLTDKVKAQI